MDHDDRRPLFVCAKVLLGADHRNTSRPYRLPEPRDDRP